MAGQPTKIGKYDVIREIGRGGMGKVYCATDPTIGRMVAIKQVTAMVSDDPDLLKRFYREAQSTGKLQHPNIVTLYDLGEQDGIPYLVMEYLEGDSLEKIIQERRPYTVAEKLSIVVQVCEGLAYAHQRTIIHRDIKPGNIVVLNDGGVKIVDFGIAQFGNERYTRTGMVVGSLYYMSPEQLQDADIDARSDIYSAGIVLYEFLTGSVPFRGKDPASTLAKILHDSPASLSNLAGSYSADLDAVVRRALAKDRNTRYSSMEDLGFDLRSLGEKLSRELIETSLGSAESLMGSGQWDKAREQLRQVLNLDKQHRRANELLREVQVQIQRQQRGEQVRRLRLRADEALGLRNWEEALLALDEAIKLDNSNTELIEFRQSVSRSAALLTEALRRAESAHNAGDLEGAKRAVEEALSVDPYNTTAKALNAILSKEISERSKQKKIDEFVAGARKEIALRHFTAALELLHGAEALDASMPEVQQLIRSATAGREHEKRRLALEKACSEIEDLLNRDEYGAACAKADEALLSFPQDLGLLKLKGFAEKQREAWSRRQFIESRSATARQLADSGDLVQAQQILAEALERYPDDTGVISLLGVITDAVARQEAQRREVERLANERRRYLRIQLEAAAELQQAGQTAQALKKVQEGLVDYPDSAELRSRAVELEERLAREETLRRRAEEEARLKRAEVEKTIAESWQLLSSKQTGQAVTLLGEALRRHPDSADLKSQLEFAQRRLAVSQAERERVEQQARRRLAEIQKEVATAQRFMDARQTAEAFAVLERALAQYPESDELKSLLQVAHSRLAVERAERESAESELRQKRSAIENEIVAARELLDAKRTGDSIARLELALGRYPDSEELKGALALARQRLAAEEAAREKAKEDERRRRAWIDAEITATRQWIDDKQADRAVTSLQQALHQYPDNEELKTELEVAKRRLAIEQSEREKAEQESRRKQADIEREIALGWQLLDAKKTDQAVVSLEKAVRRFPESKELRSQFELAKNRFAEEEAEKERIAEGERRKLAEIQRAILSAQQFVDSGQSNRGVAALELASKRYPESSELKAHLEQARQRLAVEEAERERAAQVARRKQEEVRKEIAAAARLLESGQTVEAVASIEAALRRLPDSEELKNQLRRATERVAEEEAAKRRVEEERRQRQAEITRVVESAGRLLASHQTGGAVSTLEEGLRRYPESGEIKASLEAARKRMAAEQAERERAEREAQQRRNEINKEIAGATKLLNSKAGEAVAALEGAVRRFPDSNELQDLLKAARQRLAQEQEAKLRAEENLKRRQREIEAQVAAVRALLEAKQTSKAVAALEQATQKFPDSSELRSLYTKAQETQQQERAAQEKAEREAQQRRDRIAAEIENARRLLKAGQTSKSVAALETAAANYQESDELRSLLAAAKEQQGHEIAEREKAEKKQAQLQAEAAKVKSLLERGDPEQALNAGEVALRALGKDTQLLELLENAKAAVKQKKAEEKRRAAERQQAEERKHQRDGHLADLQKLVVSAAGAKPSALEKLQRRAEEIAARYPGDAEIQENYSETKTALESALADLREKSRKAEARSAGAKQAAIVSQPIATPARETPTVPSSGLLPKFLNRWTAIAVVGVIALGIAVKYFSSKIPLPPSSFTVSVETQPTGATIQVGNQTCITPNCRLNLSAGKYQIKALLQGYRPLSQDLLVSPQEPLVPLKLVLVPEPPPNAAGYLLVKAGIEGADVLINGSKYSQTASGGTLRLPLDPGTYTVEVQKKGYVLAKSQRIQIHKGQDTPAEFTLSPLPTAAQLVIAGATPNVQVLADGRYLGLTGADGSFSQSVEAGDHEIVLVQDNRRSNVIRKTFSAGQRTSLEGKQFTISAPPRSTAAVTITNLPNTAVIKAEGATYRPDAAGTARFEIPAGEHTLEIVADGYKPRQIRQSFPAGQVPLVGSLDRLDLEGPEWAKVESSTDMAALQGFLNDFPKGNHAQQAQSRLDKLIAGSGSEQELQAFAARFPNTPAGDAAKKRVERMRADAGKTEQDRQGINGLLQQYRAAYENLDFKALTDLYPDLSPAARKATQTKFKNAVSVKVVLNSETPILNGDQASIKVTQTLNWTQKDRSQSSETTPALTWQLVKKDGRWLVQKGP